MNEQEEQQLTDIVTKAAEEIAEILRPGLFPAIRKALAETEEPAETWAKFKVGDYVCGSSSDSIFPVWKVSTVEAFKADRGHDPVPAAKLFLLGPNGNVYWQGLLESVGDYTLWKPKKNERVRQKAYLSEVGTVFLADHNRQIFPYCIDWDSGARTWYRLSQLQPACFKPEEKPKEEKPKPEFKVGDYIVCSLPNLHEALRRVTTMDAFNKTYPSGPHPDRSEGIPIVAQEGAPFWGSNKNYFLWEPKKGEKVRRKCDPQQIGEVIEVAPGAYYPYRVEWKDTRPRQLPHTLFELQPESFRPKEKPKPKPEFKFPNGMMVVNKHGDLRVALEEKGKVENTFAGMDGSKCYKGAPPHRPANHNDVLEYTKKAWGSIVTDALRKYAKTIAEQRTGQ